MSYIVKEIYCTLQGEGANTGRPAVFCRFSGCNLWSGHERDRIRSVCYFCDTDFLGADGPGGGRFDAPEALADAITQIWAASPLASKGHPFVVLTGGEPLLQLDERLINVLHRAGFEIAVETNGTIVPPLGIDWICCSPKLGSELVLRSGDELKLVFPQGHVAPDQFLGLSFRYFFLQPMDGPEVDQNTALAAAYCRDHPQWRLSLQMHKVLRFPEPGSGFLDADARIDVTLTPGILDVLKRGFAAPLVSEVIVDAGSGRLAALASRLETLGAPARIRTVTRVSDSSMTFTS